MAKKTKGKLLQEALVPIGEQPYEIPENWVWIYTPYLFDIEYGKNLAISELEEIGYPVFGANGQIGYYNEYTYEDSKILVSCRGANSGKINVSLPKSFITNNSLILNQKLNMSNDFIRYLFKSRDKSTLISGTAQPQITLKAFRSFPLPLLPQPEQQRISAKVQSLFSKIDKARELIEEAREEFKDRKASMLEASFRGDLTSNWRKDNLDIESVEQLLCKLNNCNKKEFDETIHMPYSLPDTWKWTRFKDVANISSNLVQPSEYSTFPHIAPNNIQKETGELLEYRTIEEDKVISAKHHFFEGQIIYSKIRPYLSKVIIANFEGLCSADMYPIDSKINTNYLFRYMLSSTFLDFANNSGSRTVLPKINQAGLKVIPVPVSPLQEQKEIVRILDQLLSFESEIEELTQLEDQIELLKKSILAKAFRGELGTNDPTEESAIELLKEVLK